MVEERDKPSMMMVERMTIQDALLLNIGTRMQVIRGLKSFNDEYSLRHRQDIPDLQAKVNKLIDIYNARKLEAIKKENK